MGPGVWGCPPLHAEELVHNGDFLGEVTRDGFDLISQRFLQHMAAFEQVPAATGARSVYKSTSTSRRRLK